MRTKNVWKLSDNYEFSNNAFKINLTVIDDTNEYR